jgi:hypothetical protein
MDTAGSEYVDPHFTLLRSALESSLTAFWLMDPSAEDRVVRGYAAAWDDLNERKKFERSLGWRKELDDRLAALRTQAAEQGLTVRSDVKRSGSPLGAALVEGGPRACDLEVPASLIM